MIRLRMALARLGLALLLATAAPAEEPAAPVRPEPDFLEGLFHGVQELLGIGPDPAVAPDPATAPDPEEASRVFDAFLTFVVRRAAAESGDLGLRSDLFGALLDGRHDAVSLLTEQLDLHEGVLRELLGASWPRLRPLLLQLAGEIGAERGASYQALLDAGQALLPGADWDAVRRVALAPESLRELARIIAPEAVGDPLAWDQAVDPELRALFGFGAPLEPPLENPELEPQPPPAPPLGLAVPVLRWAAVVPEPSGPETREELRELARRLNGWVPERAELGEYLPAMRRLLELSAQHALGARPLATEFHLLFGRLVLATAWKESCWRQFVRRGGRLVTLDSGVGAVGVMQINTRVWRGFYEVEGLYRDAGYNARAGSEILVHYLQDYAIRKGEHRATGNTEDLARATYAIYNGGPAQMRRYRLPATRRGLREIDHSFWEKYQAVKAGDPLAVASCYGEGGG